MKQFTIAIIITLGFTLMTACAGQAPQETVPPAPQESKTSVDEEPLVISYKDGMVTVYIEEGRASVAFDYEQWDDRYGIYHSNVEFGDYIDLLREGPFPITGLNGAVKDACIVQMDGFWSTSVGLMGIPDPAVILLMEDGTVQMALVDPGTWDMEENISYESRQIPRLRDIVSLSYEVDLRSDYNNDMTVYAVDSRGLSYNVSIAGGFGLIMDKELYARQPRIDEDFDNEGDIMTLILSEDGTAVFQKSWFYGDQTYEIYQGTYEIQLAEDPGGDRLPAGAISFDLALSWWIWEGGEGEVSAEDSAFWDAGQRLDGVYLSWINHDWGEDWILLSYFEGNGLTIYKDRRPPDEYFQFYTDIDEIAYMPDAAAGSEADMTGAADANITADEAWDIYHTWLSNHAKMSEYTLSLYYDIYEDGAYYYWFCAENPEWYWYNILVDMETGELFFMMTPDGEDATPLIEPLDDYYSRYYD